MKEVKDTKTWREELDKEIQEKIYAKRTPHN